LIDGHGDARHDLPVDHLDPGDLRPDLGEQGGEINALLSEEPLHRLDGHPVALGDIGQRPLDFRVLHGDVQALGLLQLQRLLDQAAQHLRGKSCSRLLVVGNATAQSDQLEPIAQVLCADHVVVHHRHDALLGPGGVTGEEQARQRCDHNQPSAHLEGPRMANLPPSDRHRCRSRQGS
jgi:hypothetical protein